MSPQRFLDKLILQTHWARFPDEFGGAPRCTAARSQGRLEIYHQYPHAQKRRRLVLSLCKIVMIKNYYWAQIESHTSGFKAPWWARRTTIQVGAKMRNMRWTYQVALLGLYRGCWWYYWYSSSLSCERAAVQRGAPTNSSGNLTQCVCKISLSKKSCDLNEKKLMTNYWNFLSFTRIQISIPTCIVQKVECFLSGARRVPIQI